jgi:hypothetical protein
MQFLSIRRAKGAPWQLQKWDLIALDDAHQVISLMNEV